MWTPIELPKLYDQILNSEKKMSSYELRFWEKIKIDPRKWAQTPYGTEGGGFWVVAIYGDNCIWYNDIEGGFNTSGFNAFGDIKEYYCNQDELISQVQSLIHYVEGK